MISVDDLAMIVNEMADDQQSDEEGRKEEVPLPDQNKGEDNAENQNVSYISEDSV